MSIAEKLVTIAENEQKVFDAGKKAEWSALWDNIQSHKGAAQVYQYAFCGTHWNDITFKPKYDLVFTKGYSGTNAFWGNGVTDIAETLEQLGLKMDTTLCGYWAGMFQNADTKRLPELNCSHAMEHGDGGLHYTFANSEVETIDKLIVVEELKYASTFKGCANLKNIIFEGVIGENISFLDSPLLTYDSIMSIINHLKDFSGTTTTMKLTLGTTNLEKLTDAEKKIATDKGWTLA